MSERRPTNSELALNKLADEEAQNDEPRGILELFDEDEDTPLARDEPDE